MPPTHSYAPPAMRALFLFNHDAGHQVAHLAGIAAATARLHPDIETVAAFATPSIKARLDSLIAPEDAALIRWEDLSLSPLQAAVARPFDRVFPASRLWRLRAHRQLFGSADMIISTERTCLRLKKDLPQSRMPLFAKVPHGAGDRSVAYHPDYRRFDRSFVAGPKVVDQLVAHGVERDRLVIVGYPKFEGVDLDGATDFFGNGRPTFVYNPHFDPNLSSWYSSGPDLLRWFAGPEGRRFNLIFAPHVMLFRKRLHVSPEYRIAHLRPDIPAEALAADNILVDLDGPRLFDMSYTLSADAYIGDVSSQIYEFLVHPRPAFFIDSRKQRKAQDDEWHLFWDAGPVVHDCAQLMKLLPDHARIGAHYRARQEEIFRYTIDITDTPPSTRAANAIAEAIRSRADR
ncbi:hypothetical protein GRF63_08175 [Erythrobacter sp. GH3-10]|uniref:Glycosyl transferase n=1 Tax=Aurantiacibacter rhizosphaerae TaxID=2691582 RepID=A0A844XBM1_9SPHN|nr:hypothetical protein [Aurantiacibacter rhizosphaerae]